MTGPGIGPWQRLLADAPPQPWRNGGGQTRELLAWAPGPGPWVLRLSVADITQDGPFSPWPGVSRHFAVLSGGGLRLGWPDGRVLRLGPGAPAVSFDGADAPAAALLAGPTQDLNLMLQAGWVGGLVPLRAGQDWSAPADACWVGLYAHTEGPWWLGRQQGHLAGPGCVGAEVNAAAGTVLRWGGAGPAGVAHGIWAAPTRVASGPVSGPPGPLASAT